MRVTESVLKDLVPYWKTVGQEQIVDEDNVITADGVTPSIDLGHYVVQRSAEPATLAQIEADRRSPKCRYAFDAGTLLLHLWFGGHIPTQRKCSL